MKLIPLLCALVFPFLLTSCYTDGFGYVETGYAPSYYRSYASYYGPRYYGPRYYGSYRHHHHSDYRPRYYSSGRNYRGSRHYHNASWRGSRPNIYGWRPRRR